MTDIFRALLAGWYLLLVGLVIGGGAGVAISASATPTYVSSTKLFVAVRGQADTTAMEIASGSNAAQQKIKTYTSLVTTPRVLDPVVRDVGPPLTLESLTAAVSASSPTASTIMSVTVSDVDPQRAAELADAVTESLRSVVTTELEPEFAPGVPSVTMEVVEPAAMSSSPATPHTVANVALGLLLGLAAGALGALLRQVLDTKVRGQGDLVDENDLAVVGDIPFDPEVRRRPVVVRDGGGSLHAEAFRMLRTNIRFLGSGLAARVFAVTSAGPGEGKTTTTANLAVSLAEAGLRVVVVDADMRRPNLAKVLGIEGAVGLSDLLIGRVELDDVVQPWGGDALGVLPAGDVPPNPSELLSSGAMKALVDELCTRYDVVLIDTPPLLSVTDAALISEMVTSMLLVVASGRTRRAHVTTSLERLDAVGDTPRAAVLSMSPRRRSDSRYYYYAETPDAPRGLRRLVRLKGRP
ncbi:polysaccharide biosynthesis tyrosine autokinase [Frigoribacterium sp. VKM Ac-1396]|uniref:polysaccharide biosynthesis tyrosine autokinase n=1 Tax=Frigoribacterium sp. VKM Ac-1396 TaxID=2783821 RepID=UPI00188B76A0|nr:polysaccharide biosynthesis tyrosine autokinase [Frigoribacterium sp. VKM Ac-1396]